MILVMKLVDAGHEIMTMGMFLRTVGVKYSENGHEMGYFWS